MDERFIEEMRDMHNGVLRKAHIIDKGFWFLNNIPQEHTYGNTSCKKGGTVVNTLRNYLGDTLFFNSIKTYLQHFAYQSVSSYDLRDFLSGITGIDMNNFFEGWVFTPGTPHFSIDSTRNTPVDTRHMIDIFMRQKRMGYDFFNRDNIIEVVFIDESFNFTSDTIHFSGRTGYSQKFIDFNPLAIFLDPYEKVNDATIDNYKFFTERIDYSFPETFFKIFIENLNDPTLVRATHNFVTPDSLKFPVEGLKLSTNRYWKIDGFLSDDFQSKGRFFLFQ